MQETLMAEGGCGRKVISPKNETQQFKMDVETIKVKIGNAVNAIELGKGMSEEGGSSKKRRLSYD